MNPVLKNILEVLEKVGASQIPGGMVIDKAVHDLVDHKDIVSEIPDLGQAVIQAVEAIKEDNIGDEVKFRAGVADLVAGFQLIKESLKH